MSARQPIPLLRTASGLCGFDDTVFDELVQIVDDCGARQTGCFRHFAGACGMALAQQRDDGIGDIGRIRQLFFAAADSPLVEGWVSLPICLISKISRPTSCESIALLPLAELHIVTSYRLSIT